MNFDMSEWMKSMNERIAALGVPKIPKKTVAKKVIRKKTISKISKNVKKPEILLRGNKDKPVVISVYSNREIKKFNTSDNYLYVDLIGKDTSKKAYLRFNLKDCDDVSMIKSSLEDWKLWKTKGLEKYMGTSEYELVTRKGYSLDWAIKKFCEHQQTNTKKLFQKESVPGNIPVYMVRLVPSTSVVLPLLDPECSVCKLPKSMFFKMDNMVEFLKNSECSRLFGKCSDCVHVEKLKFKTPVVCSYCTNGVNVLGLEPGYSFSSRSNKKCIDCVFSNFYVF